MNFSEKLPSRLEIIPEFVNTFCHKIDSGNLNEEELFQVRLALTEALVNAVKHGNKLKDKLQVEVEAEVSAEGLKIRVKDQGEGFDFGNLNDPTLPENLSKTSGRGIFLIKKMMDEVNFIDGGKGIEMIKSLKRRAGSGNS